MELDGIVCFHPQTMDRVKQLLHEADVEYSERSFRTDRGPAELGSNLFVSINILCSHRCILLSITQQVRSTLYKL